MAHWLIQRGFDSDKQYLKLIESIERMNIPHSFCTVIPFSDSDDGIKLESPVPEDGNIYCYGSYSLYQEDLTLEAFIKGAEKSIADRIAEGIVIQKVIDHNLQMGFEVMHTLAIDEFTMLA